MPGVLLAGLPGTGKSTLAQALAAHFKGHVFNKDIVRVALFGPDQVAYRTDQDDLVQRFLVESAEYLWREQPGLWIFFDGRTFSRAYQRRLVPAQHTILCTAPEELVRQRLALPHPAANRNWELYEAVRSAFEPIMEPHLVVNTGEVLEVCVAQAVRYLLRSQG